MKKYIVRFYGSIVVNADNVEHVESKLDDFILSFVKETNSFDPVIEFDEIEENEEM